MYNFAEIRAELESEGAVFSTSGDTEVVLELVVRRGIEAAVPRLEGMFAFAVYDTRDGSLRLARDRIGIKPLYVYDQEDAFVFASKIAAMRPWVSLEPDLVSISAAGAMVVPEGLLYVHGSPRTTRAATCSVCQHGRTPQRPAPRWSGRASLSRR